MFESVSDVSDRESECAVSCAVPYVIMYHYVSILQIYHWHFRGNVRFQDFIDSALSFTSSNEFRQALADEAGSGYVVQWDDEMVAFERDVEQALRVNTLGGVLRRARAVASHAGQRVIGSANVGSGNVFAAAAENALDDVEQLEQWDAEPWQTVYRRASIVMRTLLHTPT